MLQAAKLKIILHLHVFLAVFSRMWEAGIPEKDFVAPVFDACSRGQWKWGPFDLTGSQHQSLSIPIGKGLCLPGALTGLTSLFDGSKAKQAAHGLARTGAGSC